MINLISAYILAGGNTDNLNLKGALLHVIGDALASVAAIVAGLFIYWKGWLAADAVASAIISIIIIYSAYHLITDTVHIILQGVPAHVDTTEIKNRLMKIVGIKDIHSFHVWSLSSQHTIMSVHLVQEKSADHHKLLQEARRILNLEFSIEHTTIQIELENFEDEKTTFS
jgi:cobalt-zinc-cadmium efflux system protein